MHHQENAYFQTIAEVNIIRGYCQLQGLGFSLQVDEHTMVPQFTIMEVACVLAFETLDDIDSKDISLSNVIFNGNAIDNVPCLLNCTMDILKSATQLSISTLHDIRQEPIAKIMSAHTSGLWPPHLQLFPSTKIDQGASTIGFQSWKMSISSKRPSRSQTPIMSSLALASPKDRVNGVWLQPGTAESSLQLTNMLLKEAQKVVHGSRAWQATSCSAFVARYATPS